VQGDKGEWGIVVLGSGIHSAASHVRGGWDLPGEEGTVPRRNATASSHVGGPGDPVVSASGRGREGESERWRGTAALG